MKKGKFIIIEGGEGSGKSTVVKYVTRKLESSGINVIATREPGGSNVAEGIRKSFINCKLEPISQLFCFLAARAVWTEQILIPTLKKCEVVITDRSFPTTYSYQGIVGKLGLNRVIRLNNIAIRKIKPSLVIILDVDAKVGLKRSHSTGDTNVFERENITFHIKANKAYLDLAKRYHWKIVSAMQPLKNVQNQTLELIMNLMRSN